ncbi:ArnT family glycosyltransferase [Amycolatopsis cihanbeyliensis]|uniref:4-amino-4-deoxy-L-arabinose transferase-like glycosyltransferase n=1 Tax=Amycolatopsis cihanbeyliensis TaxID=1128664 RepID=A0A542DE59_AMYCI|nr:glycosyltransferase family 39 protein [Amycolatopsis cihanbeyliensis]TQJ01359.1 4-amino-4-deoxy-L-arabinose transferase-like glycosyltransferase [Amycolatopsis cihanbeyliensis]
MTSVKKPVEAGLATPAATAHERGTRPRWHVLALGAICVLAGVLYLWALSSLGYGRPYLASAVLAMSQDWQAFLFGSMDLSNTVTIDKPPLALWPQAILVSIFGYHGWALLLPQALGGVLTVFLLHRTVRLWAGEKPALLASLILAVTPVAVAINRVNLPDTLLILFCVAAAYALTRALLRDSTGWLLLGAGLLGCGFATKMLQAWVVVPAFVVAYLIGSRTSWRRRVAQLGGAAAVLLASSLWWVALVDLWPGRKPYVGGSTDGSAWDLVFGYSGLSRLIGDEGDDSLAQAGMTFSGDPGWGRLFNEHFAGQISWFLPLCALVLVVAAVRGGRNLLAGRHISPLWISGWAMWGGWLLSTAAAFSFAEGLIHPYYATMAAPAVAAVSATGLAVFSRWYRARSGGGWLLPAGIAATGAWAFVVATRQPAWHGWVRWAAVVTVVIAVGVLAVTLLAKRHSTVTARSAAAAGLAAVLLTPAVWATGTAFGEVAPDAAENPLAGPVPAPGDPMQQVDMQIAEENRERVLHSDQRAVLEHVTANAEGQDIVLAVEGGISQSAPYIMNSERPVSGMGGFLGGDPAPSVTELAGWVSSGRLRFVLSNQVLLRMPEQVGTSHPIAARTAWVQEHCETVDPASYLDGAPTSPTAKLFGGPVLFDCARG